MVWKRMLTLKEVGLQATGDCSGKQRLTSTRRTIKQNTLWRLDAYSEEKLGIFEGKLNDLSQFSDLVVQTTNSAKRNLTGVLQRHVVHERIHLAGQHAHDCQSGHVECYSCALLQLRLVNLVAAANDIARS